MFKILIATDGSNYAYRAADFAGSLAGHMPDAEFTVLSVLDLNLVAQTASISPSGMPMTVPLNVTSDMEAAVNEMLQDTRERLLATGRPVTARLEFGDPARVICDIADREHFDLIVMGPSGHGRVADILLGSVSDRVIHEASVPVLIVRTKSSGTQ